MSIQNLSDLFVHTMKDIYYAEKQVKKALPKMVSKAHSTKLKRAFEEHLEETTKQIERLEKAFKSIDTEASGEKCPAIDGIIKESEELMEEVKDKHTLDAALIAAAQAVEHYEITRYGTLCVWAEQLGHKEAMNLFQENLAEEENADAVLSHIAKSDLNERAA